MRYPTETDNQFLERMKEKYKEALEIIENEGLNATQIAFDQKVCELLDLEPLEAKKTELQHFNIQMRKFLCKAKQ